MINIYGIKNCNTVKKALNWFAANDISYIFHDYKKEPASRALLETWTKKVSWEVLLNKKGTTWKKLDKDKQELVVDDSSAIEALLGLNSMIKRPIVELRGQLVLGFDEELYTKTFKR